VSFSLAIQRDKSRRGKKAMDQNITITPHLNGLEFPAAIFFPKDTDTINGRCDNVVPKTCVETLLFHASKPCRQNNGVFDDRDKKKPKKLQRKRFISGATSGSP